MPNLRLLAPLTVILAAGAGLLAQAPPAVIENDQVRVLKVTDQAHARSQPHDHKLNRVMVYLQPGHQEFTTGDGKKTVLDWKAGDVKWSPASGTHVSEITSNVPVTMIEVEIKKEGNSTKGVKSDLDPVKVDPKTATCGFFESGSLPMGRFRSTSMF